MNFIPQVPAVLVTAQILSILGMLFNCLSYQGKSKRALILMQFFGTTLFTVHFFMLGAALGFLMNLIGAIRGLTFSLWNPGKTGNRIRIAVFLCLILAMYPLAFTVLGVEPTAKNLILEVLPIIAVVITTVSYGCTSAGTVRKLALFSAPFWLVYNICNLSAGGILCEIFVICSALIGIFRYDRK